MKCYYVLLLISLIKKVVFSRAVFLKDGFLFAFVGCCFKLGYSSVSWGGFDATGSLPYLSISTALSSW